MSQTQLAAEHDIGAPRQGLEAFRACLAIGWIVLAAAGFVYARRKDVPVWAAVPIVGAFLSEFLFYLVPGFEAVRERLSRSFSKVQLALAMTVSAMAPWVLYSAATGEFRMAALVELAVAAAVFSFWYTLWPVSAAADFGYLLLLAAAVLANFPARLYLSPIHQHIEVLGHLMLIRTCIMAVLMLRGIEGVGFGFLPTEREWVIGLREFFYFAPIGFSLALWFGMVRFNWEWMELWKWLLVFAGMFWVVALSEEFFFRGMLQQWLARWTGSPLAALLLASVVFGACHLPFHSFPNWRLAIVAAVAGIFYGRAYRRAGSIRASMVSHALVATTWRVLLSG